MPDPVHLHPSQPRRHLPVCLPTRQGTEKNMDFAPIALDPILAGLYLPRHAQRACSKTVSIQINSSILLLLLFLPSLTLSPPISHLYSSIYTPP